MELIKDYDCTIAYHPRKVNIVAYMLSRKSSSKENKGRKTLLRELKSCKAILNVESVENLIARYQVKSTIEEEIVESQPDPVLRKLAEEVECKCKQITHSKVMVCY